MYFIILQQIFGKSYISIEIMNISTNTWKKLCLYCENVEKLIGTYESSNIIM